MNKVHTSFTIAFSIVAVVAIVWGVLLVGSPASARADPLRLISAANLHAQIQAVAALIAAELPT